LNPQPEAAFLLTSALGENVESLLSHLPNCTELAGKTFRATLLAETFPGSMAQVFILLITNQFRRL
jgi:hypothetical protein